MRNGAKSRGFTLIEVMIGLLVFMVAVVGLVALQRASNAGKTDAQFHTSATNIAQLFLSQLRSEVEAWPYNVADKTAANRQVLFNSYSDANELFLVKQGVINIGTWQLFDSADATFQIDPYMGFGVADGGTDMARYCLNYRLDPMDLPPATRAAPTPGNLGEALVWKLRVRVSWTRDGKFPQNWNNCTPATVAERLDPANIGTDNAVELVTLATRDFAQ